MSRSDRVAVVFALTVACASAGETYGQGRVADHPRVAESLRLVDMWLEAELAYERIPGMSVAIIFDQELVWAKGYGYADVARRAPAAANTLYSACSIAKVFTATAILRLHEEGKLQLDDAVEKHLNWFRVDHRTAEPITIAQLLTHSSGLVRDLPAPYWTGPDYSFPSREAFIASVGRDWFAHPPGTRHEYSNVGMTLAGELVTKLSGMPYEEYVRRHIFQPLGMAHTSSTPTNPAGASGLAQGYTLLRRDGSRQAVPTYHVRSLAAVAGLVSTVEDLARFASWQFRTLDGRRREVITGTALRSMQDVQFMPADSWTTAGYGYQIWRENDRTFVGHAGTCPGFQSQLLVRPQEKIATVAMINAQGVSPNRYTQRSYDIMAAAFRAATGASGRTATDPQAAALERLAGIYERPFGSELLVLPWQGRIAVVALPTQNPLSSMATFEAVGDGRFRRSGVAPSVAEVIEFRERGGRVELWRNHQYWIRHR